MLRVAIIGFGARGLGILERLVSKILHHRVNDEIIITIFDPISEGSGCHNPKQSPLLLANTVASQMSIFADDSVIKNEFFIRGFNFYEFLCYKSYHCSKNGYYSRSILGEYLEYAFGFIQKIAPKNICIRIIKEEALSIEKQNSLYLIKSSNHSFDAHGAFITTGHGLSHTLALEQKIEAITSKDTVIVEGLGLSAIDIFTLLSIGKGGSFKQNKMGDLTYLPSQKEPKILAFSRSNIPLMARAITQKESQEVHQSIHFTSQAIKKIRNQKNKLDFQKDILPLIILEMQYTYSYTYLAQKDLQQAFLFKNQWILNEHKQKVLDKYIPKTQQLNFRYLLNPINNVHNAKDFQRKLIDYLKHDIQEAQLGNLTSPLKTACDILRDTRDILRECIDFSALEAKSYYRFMKKFIPLNNRLCVGPPVRKIQELLALINSGVITVLYNPTVFLKPKLHIKDAFNNTHTATHFLSAKANCSLQSSDFLNSLISNHLGQLNPQSRCLEINKNLELIYNSNISCNLFALGLPTEGLKFYTFILPRPFISSTFLRDSNKAVDTFLNNTLLRKTEKNSGNTQHATKIKD